MINSVCLTGRLTNDPELRRTQTGKPVMGFRLAVNRRFTQPGQPDADFINCVAWNKTAETMAQYLHKGSLIGVEGRLSTRSYDNQQGQKVYVTEVVVDNFSFLESRSSADNSYQQNYQPSYITGYQQPQQYVEPPMQSSNGSFYTDQVNTDYGFDDEGFNDDLPF